MPITDALWLRPFLIRYRIKYTAVALCSSTRARLVKKGLMPERLVLGNLNGDGSDDQRHCSKLMVSCYGIGVLWYCARS